MLSIKTQKVFQWIPILNLIPFVCGAICFFKNGHVRIPTVVALKLFAVFAPMWLVNRFAGDTDSSGFVSFLLALVFPYIGSVTLAILGIGIQQGFERKAVKKENEEEKGKSSGDPPKDEMLPRYGKFNIKKTVISLIAAIVLIFSLFLIKKQITFEVFVLIGIVCGYTIIKDVVTYSELYKIQNRVLTIKKIFSKKEVVLPENMVLIVSRGSTSLHRRISYMKRPGFVELDCLMICIISDCTVQEALRLMQWNDYPKEKRYSNVIVREIFSENTYSKFLFSFVYRRSHLQKLVENHNVEIILPKSLEGEIDLSFFNVPIYVDEEA